MKHFALLLLLPSTLYAQDPILRDSPKEIKDESTLIIDNIVTEKDAHTLNMKSARKNSANNRRPRNTSAYVRKRDK